MKLVRRPVHVRGEGTKRERRITFDMAELSVGFGAELFAPKRRFIFADIVRSSLELF
jgi:hypothetical protein